MDGKDLNYGDGKIIAQLGVDLSLAELLTKVGPAGEKPAFQEAAKKNLETACSVWAPKLIYRWLSCMRTGTSEFHLNCHCSGENGRVDLGFS